MPPDQENGYPIEDFIKRVKASLNLQGVLRVFWKREGRAVAFKRNGVSEIQVATVDAIMREKSVGKDEAVAKQKVAIIEEACHLKENRDHSPEIFVCVRREVDKHLTPEERQIIMDKLQRLKQACIREEKSVLPAS